MTTSPADLLLLASAFAVSVATIAATAWPARHKIAAALAGKGGLNA